MKKIYNQPQVQVTEIQCVTVIAASNGFGLSETQTDSQW